MAGEPTYYEVLNLPRDASAEDIRRAHRELVRRYHPDANPNDPQAAELFLQVQQAYNTLSEPKKRDQYDKTLPAEVELATFEVLYSRETLPRLTEAQLLFLMLKVSAPAEAQEQPPPTLNISLVVDRSTSMQGSRMDTVKSSAIELMRQLGSNDYLSVIAFSDRAEVIMPARKATETSDAEATIQMLQTGGGTEIYQGLKAGYDQLSRNYNPRVINHMILITDGRTYGDEEQCLNLAAQAAQRGIGISALGIGSEWNDTFLDQLTNLTGGETNFIANLSELSNYLEAKVKRLSLAYASNLACKLEFHDSVQMSYAFRIHPEVTPLNQHSNQLQLGSIPMKGEIVILMELLIDKVTVDVQTFEIGKALFSGDVLSGEHTRINKRMHFKRHTSAEHEYEPSPPDIVRALSQVTLYRLQERAQQDVKQGNPAQAITRLNNLATHLLAQGETDLAKAVMLEAGNIQRTRMLSAEGSKHLKYATRGLMLGAGKGTSR